MNSRLKKLIPMLIGGTAAAVILLYGIWMWCFCRFYVPAGFMAVVTAKSGKAPVSGSILVERGEKGIWKDVLGEGRHFLNPVTHDIKIIPACIIPLGKVGIVISKVGKELPPGEIIAPDKESKGILKDVLGPGVYRLNPEGYSVEMVDAVNIPAGYAGVVTNQTGKPVRPGNFAGSGEKGVRKDILQPGLYYINRYAHQVNVIEIGMNQVSMTGSEHNTSVFSSRSQMTAANTALNVLSEQTLNFQRELRRQNMMKPAAATALTTTSKKVKVRKKSEKIDETSQIFGLSRQVEFPSRDGFKVAFDMTVEFELLPENISRIYLLYGDLPQVVEKIIMPQVLSVSRLKGSSYRAQDFIMGEGRETFQKDLQLELAKVLAEKNIIVHNAIIRNVDIPNDILLPIRAVSLAREQNLTNISLQNTAKKLGELNTETELIEQRRREVNQETAKLVATIDAEKKRIVASIDARAKLDVAKIQLKRSEIEAKTAKLRGETEVQAEFLVDSEKAHGYELRSKVLTPNGLLLFDAVEAINPKVETRIIYAGEGTLWTDLKNNAITIPAKK